LGYILPDGEFHKGWWARKKFDGDLSRGKRNGDKHLRRYEKT
jgi:hypothetical protein